MALKTCAELVVSGLTSLGLEELTGESLRSSVPALGSVMWFLTNRCVSMLVTILRVKPKLLIMVAEVSLFLLSVNRFPDAVNYSACASLKSVFLLPLLLIMVVIYLLVLTVWEILVVMVLSVLVLLVVV